MNTRSILALLLAGTALLTTARADQASDIAAGRLALVNRNLLDARTHFRNAALGSPDPEANVLYGLTRAAAILNAPDSAALLTKLGVPTAGRNVLNWQVNFPQRYTKSTLTSDQAEATILAKVLPELAAASENLAFAVDPAFALVLSADETHSVEFTIDLGDVKFIRSLIHTVICGTHLLDTQESNLTVGEIDKLLYSNGLTLERLLTTKPTLFTAEAGAGAAAVLAGGAYTDAVNIYTEASAFIRARVNNTGRLIVLDPSQDAPEAENLAYLQKVRDSLATAVAFDAGTQLHGGAFIASPVGIRTVLPTPYKNNGPTLAATVPDPTMGGVLPGMTGARVLDWFRSIKRDLDKAFRFRDDPIAPKLAVTSPRGSATYDPAILSGEDFVIVTGTATDNLGVQRVEVEADGRIFPAHIVGADPKTITWETMVPADPGVNTITVTAFDGQPNPSKSAVVKFTFIKNSTVDIRVVGDGRVSRGDGDFLIGKATPLTAKPGKDWIFQAWDLDGNFVSTGPKLAFEPPNSLTSILTATFIPNPYPGLVGIYQVLLNGNITDPITSNVTYGPVSTLALSLGAKGSFTISGSYRGKPIKAKGSLDGFGNAQITIKRKGLAPLYLAVFLDTFGTGLSLNVFDEATFDSADGSNNLAQPGIDLGPRLNIVLEPDRGGTSAELPLEVVGSGYATLTRDKAGSYRVAGKLPDGSSISFSTAPSDDGVLHFPIFQASARGDFLSGRLDIDAADRYLSGYLQWADPANPFLGTNFDGTFYTLGSAYTPPLKGQRIAPLGDPGNGSLTVKVASTATIGDIDTTAFGDFTVSTSNKVTFDTNNSTGGLILKLTPATGLFSGSYIDPGSEKHTFSGVIVQPTPGGIFSPAGISAGFGLRPGTSDRVNFSLQP